MFEINRFTNQFNVKSKLKTLNKIEVMLNVNVKYKSYNWSNFVARIGQSDQSDN